MYECIVICRYVMKSDAFLCAQSGLMPVSKTDYPKYPLTSGGKLVYSARIQNFHLAVSHLRCFDARITRPTGEVKFNWWDRNNDFINGVRRVPPYTDLYWAMFYKLAPFLGGMKKLILEAEDVLSTELHATLTGHTVNISILSFWRACECGEAGGSESSGRHIRVAVRGAGRAAPASAPCRNPTAPEATLRPSMFSRKGKLKASEVVSQPLGC